MQQIVFNIGYVGNSSSAILSYYPTIWDNISFPKFAKKMRQKGNIKALFRWAKYNHVPPSTIVLYITIWHETEYWNYSIKMINTREYRKYWEEYYGKEWKKPEVNKNYSNIGGMV
jgi:hypothetical protein